MFQRTKALLQTLGECSPDRHCLTDRLHLRAEDSRCAWQFLEGPSRDLGHDVVDRRLEAGGCCLGNVVGDLVEGVSDRQFGGDLGDRKAGRLRCQRRGTRDAWVHLDHDLAAGLRVDSELHVRSPGLHADSTNTRQRSVAHLLILDIGQCLLWGDGDRVTSVDAHWIDVLDRADDHAVVRPITHHLELVLLPTSNRFLDENRTDRTRRKTIGSQPLELVGSAGDAGATATEDVGRSDDHGQPDLCHHLAGVFEVVCGSGSGHFQADLDHRFLKLLTVLRCRNRFGVGADHFWLTGNAD